MSNQNDKLIIHDNHCDIYPGKMSGEFIYGEDKITVDGTINYINNLLKYKELSTYVDWRQQLSVMGDANIVIDKVSWNSVSSYMLAMKFKNVSYAYDALTKVRLKPFEMRAAANRFVVKGNDLIEWNARANEYFSIATIEKFKQNPKLLQILKLTLKAELYTIEPNIGLTRCVLLEKIRDQLISH